MDYVNFPTPGSPMLDHVDWDWACESGLCGGDNDIQLDGSTPLTLPEGGLKFFNVYGIYNQSVKLTDVVRGSGVEWYFVPLNCEAWASNDVNEEERYALKLRQIPCYSQTGMLTETSRVSQDFDVHYITSWKPDYADDRGAASVDTLVERFFSARLTPENAVREALESYSMQREAAKLEAAPPVGEPALLKMMAPVYFHCTDKKDGTPSVQRRWVKAVYFGFETCIADTDNCYADLFCDTDWAIDMAHETWWDLCNYQLIPFIRDLELDAEEAKAVREERDIVHGDTVITRQEILDDLFDLCKEQCRDLHDPEWTDEVMVCFTEGAEELLDTLCDIVAEGGDLSDHTCRDLFCMVEIDAWDCYNAFIIVNDDVSDLRERLYSVGAGADLHQGNVAYWNGDLVCIDFGACSST